MTPSQSAALSNEPCAWCKSAHENFTACVPGVVALCASCLVEMLECFGWETRRNAAEQLGSGIESPCSSICLRWPIQKLSTWCATASFATFDRILFTVANDGVASWRDLFEVAQVEV